MVSHKNDSRKRLPYPSFIGCILRADHVLSVGTLHTTPSDSNELDEKGVQKMYYVKDSKGNWYYDDKLSPGTSYYDFVIVPKGTDPELVKQMKENMEKEYHNLENDVDMDDAEEGEASDDDDLDYDPENDHDQGYGQNHPMMDLSEVMTGMRDLKLFMTQKFYAQDMQF